VKRVIRTSLRFGKHWEIVSVIPNHALGFNISRKTWLEMFSERMMDGCAIMPYGSFESITNAVDR
jgi:hypothetical protein